MLWRTLTFLFCQMNSLIWFSYNYFYVCCHFNISWVFRTAAVLLRPAPHVYHLQASLGHGWWSPDYIGSHSHPGSVQFRLRSRSEHLKGEQSSQTTWKVCFPNFLPFHYHPVPSSSLGHPFSVLKPEIVGLTYLTVACTSCDHACILGQEVNSKTQRRKIQSGWQLPPSEFQILEWPHHCSYLCK